MLRRLLGRGSRTSASPASDDRTARDRVSVVIPLYNHAGYIAEAIDSALSQGEILHELIVVDDGSNDGSAEIVRRLAAEDPRLVFWSQPNRGAPAALGAGISRASGDFIAILNSDDVFRPGRLPALVTALDQDPACWMATSRIDFIDQAGGPVGNPWYEQELEFWRKVGDLGTALLNGNIFVSSSNFLVRRDMLARVGLFAPLRYAHDLDFALRLLLQGGRVAIVETPLLSYRMHPANTINEDHARVRMEWAMAAGAYLTGLTNRMSGGQQDWTRTRALLAVLEEHRILQGATLCAAYLRSHPPATLERSGMMNDEVFCSVLMGCL